jgi:hypothetical protein
MITQRRGEHRGARGLPMICYNSAGKQMDLDGCAISQVLDKSVNYYEGRLACCIYYFLALSKISSEVF